MAELELQQPGNGGCTFCGGTPTSEDGKKKTLPMIVGVGMDVNWGEPLQACQNCVGVMADLLGRVDSEKHRKLQDKYDRLMEQHEELQENYEEVKGRIKKLLGGTKAKKELQEMTT